MNPPSTSTAEAKAARLYAEGRPAERLVVGPDGRCGWCRGHVHVEPARFYETARLVRWACMACSREDWR